MAEVSDSAAIKIPEIDIPSGEYPFAYRLMKFLERNEVVVSFEAIDYRNNPFEDESLQSWTQLNVSSNSPEDLGEEIVKRFGKRVTFSELPLPKEGVRQHDWPFVEFGALTMAQKVRVRHLLFWFKDSMIQRWDILVKETENG